MKSNYQYIPSLFKVKSIEFDNPVMRSNYASVKDDTTFVGFDIRNSEGAHMCCIMASGEEDNANFLFFRDKNRTAVGVSYDIECIPLDEVEHFADRLEPEDFTYLGKLTDKDYLAKVKELIFQMECINLLGSRSDALRSAWETQERLIEQLSKQNESELDDVDEEEEDDEEIDGTDFAESNNIEEFSNEDVIKMLNDIADKKPLIFSSIATMVIEISKDLK